MKGLIDSTLREGEQTVGVSFAVQEKLAIVHHLLQIGIEEIELGIATPGDEQLLFLIREIRRAHSGAARLALWCRCKSEDIRHAATLGADVVSLSIPVSDRHIARKLGRGKAWVLETVGRSIALAKDLGVAYVSLGLEDASRGDRAFLEQVVNRAEQTGADRLRLADTVGILSPTSLTELLRFVRGRTALPLGVHTHNDFGMATANALTALENGADWADVTVLGLGERAGNARLEEVAAFLALQKNLQYDVSKIRAVCDTVARAARRDIPLHRPVVGKAIFRCETGLHLQGLLRDPATYEPYDPQKVGGRRELCYGKKIGRGAMRDRLSAMGCRLGPDDAGELARRVRQQADRLGRPLGEHELRRYVQETVSCLQGMEERSALS